MPVAIHLQVISCYLSFDSMMRVIIYFFNVLTVFPPYLLSLILFIKAGKSSPSFETKPSNNAMLPMEERLQEWAYIICKTLPVIVGESIVNPVSKLLSSIQFSLDT